ncbi:hypothetical protein ASF49_08200 [Methylobacterium sp. Leaf104]|uniref:hypothetical protein n=1 Tax=Methylobacterium TaxID=407 RepID=UPI0006F270ED|nr:MULTISPECIES: hypothetical protein [Methylobacterium]KQP33839.1 hypothetical protein ASF49_08200 [Methylobacterium sp. Leaf104]MCI9879592.1 hypothetical protein [Methylobacterium goesingense]
MCDADPCRRALTPVEEARLFAIDALRAARAAMAAPGVPAGEAMLAVFTVLAAAALFPELVTDPPAGG